MLPLVRQYEDMQSARYLEFIRYYEGKGFTRDQAITIVNSNRLIRAIEEVSTKLSELKKR